jgi:hypothetical protein
VSLTVITAPLSFIPGLASFVVAKPNKGFLGGCSVSRTSAELGVDGVKAILDTNSLYFVCIPMEELIYAGTIGDLGYGCSGPDLGIGALVCLVRAKGDATIRSATDSYILELVPALIVDESKE